MRHLAIRHCDQLVVVELLVGVLENCRVGSEVLDELGEVDTARRVVERVVEFRRHEPFEQRSVVLEMLSNFGTSDLRARLSQHGSSTE